MTAIFLNNYLRLTDSTRYCSAIFVDSFDGAGQFKPGERRRLVRVQGNGCLTDITNVGGSRNTGNAIEMRDVLREFVKSPFVGASWQLVHIRRTRERKLTSVMNNMKVN